MAWVWTTVGSLGLVSAAVAYAMAALVLFARPERAMNRWLAILLVAEGTVTLGGNGLMYLTTDLATAYGWQAVGFLAAVLLPITELSFLATLDSPWTRWIRTRPARIALAVTASAIVWAFFTRKSWFIIGMEPADHAPWDAVVGVVMGPLLSIYAVLLIFGFAVALHAWRTHAPGLTKRRSGLFAAAFCVRAGGWWGILLLDEWLGIFPFLTAWAVQFVLIAYVILLAYGILSAQLFDIDLRVKWTLRRGTVAAVFLAVFFAVSEGAAAFVESRTGSTLVGIGAAALLVFALAPLQRAADRIADAAMPHVRESSDYFAYRKLEVYRAALEGAIEDGTVSSRERAMLGRLRDSLGIAPEDAARLEQDVVTSSP